MNYHLTDVIAPATSFALISVDAAKDELGLPADDEAKDGLVAREIAQVSAAINTYCGRVFVRQSYRDRFRFVNNWLRSGSPLMVRQPPIIFDTTTSLPVITVKEGGAVIAVEEYDLHRDTGALWRLSSSNVGAWTGTDIIVDYDGGYIVIPEDVQGAALSWLNHRWSSRGRDPMLRSQMIPDVVTETYWVDPSTTAASMPSDVRSTLNSYRIWSV